MAQAMGRTTAQCDRSSLTGADGETANCTVTYEGLKVPWSVTFQGSTGIGRLVGYKAQPGVGILTREGVERDFWSRDHAYARDLRCADLPKAELVPLDLPTRYRCEYLTDSFQEKGKTVWIEQKVTVTEAGPLVL